VHLSYRHKSIIVGRCIRSCFQAIGTSTYESNYIVCFKCFLIVGVCYINYGCFQTKVYKLVAVIVYARLKRKKLVLCENLVSLISLRSRYYVLRRWTHHFTYTDVANPHNRIDDVPLTTGTPNLEEDPVATYLGYYDWSTLRQSCWVGLWSSLF
jgi:hypothetical protein